MIDGITGLSYSQNTKRVYAGGTGGGNFAALLALSAAPENSSPAGTSSVSSACPTASDVLSSLSIADLFATPEEERAFAADLTNRLRAAGVDTSQPIQFTVQSDGSVVAMAGTPGKDKIDAVFAADPDLANEYRKIAMTEETKAAAKAQTYYMRKTEHVDKKTWDTLWQECIALMQQIQSVGGVLTLSGGSIESACSGLVAGLA
jgi:hypothetical protein